MKVFEEFEDFPDATRGSEYANESEASGGTVKYTDGAKYQLNVDKTLSWQHNLDWRGQLVDSKVVHEYYKDKWSDPNRIKEKRSVGVALDSGSPEQKRHWGYGGLIWVLSRSGEFYSHIPKIHRFHHSSLTGEGEVRAAGMWIVDEGELQEVSALSGHYKPNMGQFMVGVVALKKAISQAKTKLFVWCIALDDWVSLDFEHWTSMSWRDLYSGYKTSPLEDRSTGVREYYAFEEAVASYNARSGELIYDQPHAANPGQGNDDASDPSAATPGRYTGDFIGPGGAVYYQPPIAGGYTEGFVSPGGTMYSHPPIGAPEPVHTLLGEVQLGNYFDL
jgi:hypothetical protein